MHSEVIIWLVILVICIAVEACTMGLATIWFAGGALVAAIVAYFGGQTWLQIIAFLVVSLVLLLFTRPIAVKYFNKDRAKTNVESMIGRQAIVVSEIDNLQGIGCVSVSGNEWSARSVDEEGHIPVGSVVIVEAVNGVKLMVRKEES